MNWLSPNTGRALQAETAHSLCDDTGERWPVVDGIAYLRTGQEERVAAVLAQLDAGNHDAALIILLADQDDWWTGEATDPAELRKLVAQRDTLTLRAAMALLRFGLVADYFAHRWSDPTYLAGLALLEAHWKTPKTAFELAAGVGHYARELGRMNVQCVCADIVFAKCWLAKNWLAPQAEYVVFDAGGRWPLNDRTFDLVHCQDAFYFLPNQELVLTKLRDATAPGGVLAIGHLHNAGIEGGAMGPAKTWAEWGTLFPEASAYDERNLLTALIEGSAPRRSAWSADPDVEAWSIVEGPSNPRPVSAGIAMPADDAALQGNPLLGPDGPHWPSPRYAAEYGPTATWANPYSGASPERDRRRVDLPERW